MLRAGGAGRLPRACHGRWLFSGGTREVQERRIFTDEVANELRRFGDAIGRSDRQLRRIHSRLRAGG